MVRKREFFKCVMCPSKDKSEHQTEILAWSLKNMIVNKTILFLFVFTVVLQIYYWLQNFDSVENEN